MQEALRLAPALAEAHFTLGLMLFSESHTSEARAAFQRALELNPRFEAARIQLRRLGVE